MGNFTTFLWLFLNLLLVTRGFPADLLYDYENIGSFLNSADEVSSSEIKLKVPIVFYGQVYSSIFVNSNGLLSFQTDIPTFFNIEFPLDYPVIAPLYSNVDISKTGTISYYETSNADLIARASRNVHKAFSYSGDFLATSLFVATWSRVGYHRNGTDKLNTFQVVIISDGDDSFVEFLYPENGIQWIQGTGADSGLPDARAQAGFIGADDRFYVLHGSGTDQIKNIERWSNTDVPGQWIYRVGRIDSDANIEEPDTYNNVVDNTVPKSCEKGASQCHGFAKCIDHAEGFCCSCRELYYGNGKFCVKKDAPIRVNGKVNGEINGEKLSNLDLQSYIVMVDGRAYTAISKIPEPIAHSFQSLYTVGGLLGWVFAKPVADSVNGFQLTGGVFNQTATIIFKNTNHKVTIKQKGLGLDVYDQLRLDIELQGDIPQLLPEAKVNMDDYEEQFTLTGPGILQSSSAKSFTYNNLEGNSVTIEFSLDQSVIFDYCKYSAVPVGTTWRVKSSKNFISYESKEQLARFGLSSKVSPVGDFDPCAEGKAVCGTNSACVVENDSFICACHPGFEYIYKENGEAVCEDVNECQKGLNECDYNAQCVNQVGSYSCTCNPGFEGNGYYCENAQNCRNVRCPENSECVDNGVAYCQCLPGFTGNGQVCVPIINRSCHIANNCSPYGYCAIDQLTNSYYCQCLPDYIGDGYYCEPDSALRPTTIQTYTEEPVTAHCQFGSCRCPHGYERQGEYCVLAVEKETTTNEITTPEIETETEPFSCNVLNNCHRNAQCVFELSTNNHQCICNIGFDGDGYYCVETEVPCTTEIDCDPHATCIYEDHLKKSICVCNVGYRGNGGQCSKGGCISHDQCPLNEQCAYSSSIGAYECICKEGLDRDSQQQCVRIEGTCGGGICVEHAECFNDELQHISYCRCKAEYEGDGITECRPKPIPCNVVNNCDPQARCLYHQETGHYRCVCNDGFNGDGMFCYLERNCHNDPYMCHARAMCVKNAELKYTCECQPGYTGNGTICKESPRPEGNFLFLNQGKATLRIPFDNAQSAKLTHINAMQTAVGLDIDCLVGRVYWSDIIGGVIKSSTYNGSAVLDFVVDDVGSPEGISIDWVSRNVYWTDSTKDTIEVANIETKLRTTLFKTGLVNPRGIAVHPQRGKIFWSDWDRDDPKIEWANADGTGREIFLKSDSVKLPNSLVIDFDTERICYADAGTKKIMCLDIDSKYAHTIAENCTYPFGITVTDEIIYWSDWISKKIERVNKHTLERLKPLNVPLAGTNKLYGLVAVPQHCLGLVNVCQYYKSQCPVNHICLPDGKGSRRCVCGYDISSPSSKPPCIP
ncbi:nidogen-like [Photinus pyralis]|uniref:nidogen-like n=1 Tax=Photinus pyralis TaxID=7054 RepID=UPI001266F6EB|nr:nidogen-like [Photinus pyralis]